MAKMKTKTKMNKDSESVLHQPETKEDSSSYRLPDSREWVISGNKVRLRRKQLSDARKDYAWQTDPDLVQLDAAPLLTISFPHYILDYTSRLYYSTPNNHRFAIETLDSKHIGSCSYYNIDETAGEIELGIVIGDRDYWNKGYGTDALTTLVNCLLTETNINRLHLKTLEWNVRAQKCFRKCGFAPCGHLYRDEYSFVVMELLRKKWQESRGER